MKKIILFLVISICTVNITNAGKFRAGEITYHFVSGFTYEFKLVTYTDLISYPEVTVECGDGNLDTLTLINIVSMPNGEKKNEYLGFHTYVGIGTYTISFEIPNRIDGINNIMNSVDVPFFIETTLVINPILGVNNSTVLNNSPIDTACVGQIFIYNPTAYDMDGDSLVYILDICKGEGGVDIPSYILPSGITFDINTGDFIWDSPQFTGCYNFAIRIEEYRNGVFIGSVLRELQIIVTSCVGIKDVINGENGISVFPNPTTSSISIDIANSKANTISIYSIDGSLVYNQQVKNQKTTSIDVSKLAAGVYVLRVVGDGFVGVRKVVKE